MATSKTAPAPVGSAAWMQSEREHAKNVLDEHVEDFGFSVRTELDWLNEHMADIFSRNPVEFADLFKTPGRLRGKTPRTARKRDAAMPRQPLTDIFAPNPSMGPPPPPKNALFTKVAHFEISEDQENRPEEERPKSDGRSPRRIKPTDSGYHGTTEDEMDLDTQNENAASSQHSMSYKIPLREDQGPPQRIVGDDTAETAPTSDESFISAKEDLSSRNQSREQVRPEIEEDIQNSAPPDEEMDLDEAVATEPVVPTENQAEFLDDDMNEPQASPTPSETSPAQPLQRKSSFAFSALPARAPIGGKQSMGYRESQNDVHFGLNNTLTKSFGGTKDALVSREADEQVSAAVPEASTIREKTSTQLLHERINLLGQVREARQSKSIPSNSSHDHVSYPQLPDAKTDSSGSAQTLLDGDVASQDTEEDDWIPKSKPAHISYAAQEALRQSPVRPTLHQKSISTTDLVSPVKRSFENDARLQKAASIPNVAAMLRGSAVESTTPAGSPLSKRHDAPLSASKNRLWSALKAAKNIFASSASASAAAKLEAHDAAPAKPMERFPSNDSGDLAMLNMPGALRSTPQLVASPSRQNSIKTRSSSESDRKREKEFKAQQKAEEDLEKARDKERKRAAKDEARQAELSQKQQEASKPAETQDERERQDKSDDAPTQVSNKGLLTGGKLRAGRFVKPSKADQTAKPVPVAVRVASQSQRVHQGPSQTTLSKSQRGETGPPVGGVAKTTSRPASAQAGRKGSAAPNNARLKALEAAARKKEAEEKVAQKKAEQKRELERKRAAKLEEERRAEEDRKLAEQQRIQEARLVAQKKAEQQAAEMKRREQQRLEQQRAEQQKIEQQRLEQQRLEQQRYEQQRLEQQRLELQRQQEELQRAKAANQLAEELKRERAQQQPFVRGDIGGTLRHLAKTFISSSTESSRPAAPANAAKSIKRVLNTEDEEAGQQSQRPGLSRGPASYQQLDAKRRRTNEEAEEHEEKHSVMAPPKRPSTMRKESTISRFPHGYAHAPPPAAHHVSSMFKSTLNNQHQMQHNKGMPTHPSQTVHMSNARIPFAENTNPPAAHPSMMQQAQQQMYSGYENASANKYKTPARPAKAPKSAKSSPLVTNGDHIQLPEIQTDSEDEDSDDEGTAGFRVPSWVASPALRDLLTQQQLVDPETVFGPIGELKMEEVFKNGKQDRLKRFRDRGSSAAWLETGDAVTSAEKRKDMQGRERVAREGGWRFDPVR